MNRTTKIAIGITHTEKSGVIPTWNDVDWMRYIKEEAEKARFGHRLSLRLDLSKLSNESRMERMADGRMKVTLSEKAIQTLKEISRKIIHTVI